jgi:hypothetical protein
MHACPDHDEWHPDVWIRIAILALWIRTGIHVVRDGNQGAGYADHTHGNGAEVAQDPLSLPSGPIIIIFIIISCSLLYKKKKRKKKRKEKVLDSSKKISSFQSCSHLIQILNLFDEFWLFLNCCWIILN